MLLARATLRESLRHLDGMRIAMLGMPVDVWAAGIWESQQSGHFVETFSCRVIQCRPHHLDITRDVVDMQ